MTAHRKLTLAMNQNPGFEERDTRTWISGADPEIDARRPFHGCATRFEPYIYLHKTEFPGWEEFFSESDIKDGEWIHFPLFRRQTSEEYWAGVRETLMPKAV